MIRKEKGLTLEDLSGISGVSKSMLGEIERGGTNPTILVLWKIAEGLKIPLTRLIEQEKKEVVVVRSNESNPINDDPDFQIYCLFPYYDPHRLEVHKVDIAPLSKLSNPGHMKGIEEYIFLIKGHIQFRSGEFHAELNPGDAVRFNGEAPHAFINRSDNHARFINVMIYA